MQHDSDTIRAVNRIGRLRERLQRRFGDEFSAVEFARRVGVSRRMLDRYEAGLAVPSTLVALRIARELGVTVEQLGFQEVAPPVTRPTAEDAEE